MLILLFFFLIVGAVFGVAIVGTIFSNVLTTNLATAAIPPEYIEAVKQSATIVNQLPDGIREQIVSAYVNSLSSAFTALIPIGIICFISSIFMGNHKPKLGKSETIVDF